LTPRRHSILDRSGNQDGDGTGIHDIRLLADGKMVLVYARMTDEMRGQKLYS
jgi:hypothetical protein